MNVSDRFGITFPSVGNSFVLAFTDYSSAPAELDAAKEIVSSSEAPKYSHLYGPTHLFRIHSDVTNSALNVLSNSAKAAGVALSAGRLGTIVAPIAAITFASFGMNSYAIKSVAVYGFSLLTHMFASMQLQSEYAQAVVSNIKIKDL